MLSTDAYNYALPQSLIAQHPLKERTASRLMVLDRGQQTIVHHQFQGIVDFIRSEDLIVINNTKVIPARLFGQKESGGKLECLIERVLNAHEALAHIRSSKSPKPGSKVVLESKLAATVMGREGELFHLKFDGDDDLFVLLERYGHMPLPPYIERSDEVTDRERYQTVFAQHKGAVAAPTASLHFDQALLNRIRDHGTQITEITLHVGAGTFQPVRVNDVTQHHMHSEWIDVSQQTIDAIHACKARGGRVIAVGTTVMRALESAAITGTLKRFEGDTDIFIYPGFKFQCVDALLTNFHLPKSTLLMLVAAFAGYDFTLKAYQAAVDQQYRFFSYGDAMFILANF